MKEPQVLILNPYDHTAKYLPRLHMRIKSFARDVIRNPHYDFQANVLISRLTMRDPKILIAFAVDENDNIVMHTVCEILEVDDLKICFVGQTRSDIPGVLDKALYILDNWARSNDCDKIRTESVATVFSEKAAIKSAARYGYKLISYSFERDIGDGRKTTKGKGSKQTGPESGRTEQPVASVGTGTGPL